MTAPPADPVVVFDGVSLTLGRTEVLRDISLRVAAGSIHCLVGPNGGGKTSLIRCLLGQMPHRGRITLGLAPRAPLGYMPQSLDFDLSLPVSVENFISMILSNRPAFLGPKRADRSRIREALARVGMEGKAGRRIGELSGGERQRVLLAQALLPEPSLLVLDEPATGLDQAGTRILEEVILDLRRRGVTTLWVHHDLQQVLRISDTVSCINRRVVFAGPTREVLTPGAILGMFASAA